MDFKYLHLINNTGIKHRLRNAIGKNNNHLIITTENEFKDFDDNVVSEENFKSLISRADVVFVHFLDYKKAKIVNSLDDEKKIVWFCWGGDAYYLSRFEGKFLLDKTKKARIIVGFKSWKGIKDLFKLSIGKYADLISPNKDVIKAIRKTDVIVPVVDRDYKNLKDNYDFKATFFHANYINNLFYNPPTINEDLSGNNILLGNSASFSNNHIEIIDHISNHKANLDKVFIPLSYGNMHYGQYVSKYAKKKLGSSAQTLRTRLPFDDYIKLTASCEWVIMNHKRQQAMGNIILALWLGKTVFINSKSGSYEILRDRGFKIVPTEDFNPAIKISTSEKEENKKLLYKWYGPEYLEKRFNHLLEQLEQI